MIKRLLILCFLISCSVTIKAQLYGNEWINFSQKHYRINIPKTGLYRIDSLTLVNSGIPVNTINPKNFQLFIKGVEQHIYIKGENDNVLNASDYIEFFAEKNDGRTDSIAYTNITRLPNPYVALYNDTNYAFLTWNTSLNNNRVTVEADINFSGYTPLNYFYTEKVYTGSSYYSVANTFISSMSDPRYLPAEGFGLAFNKGQTLQTNFGNLNNYASAALPVYIKVAYSGASLQGSLIGFDHQIKLEYLDNFGNYVTLNDTTFFGFKQFNLDRQITANKLQSGSGLRITSVNNPSFGSNNNVTNLHYLYLKYPQQPNLSGASEQFLFIDNNTFGTKSFLDLQNVSVGGSSVVLYDLTNHKYIATSVAGNNVKALIPNASSQKKCFLTTGNNVINVASLAPVNQTGYFVNYQTTSNDSAFVIISHKGLQSSANQYKSYRQSIAGGSHHVILAYMDELYDQFAYGNKKNPLAIKNFCSYLSDNLPVPPKYLLLLGKSIKNNLVRFDNGAYWNANELPTMGTPSSDNLLTSGIHGSNSSTPFIPIGRISARTNLQVTWYLDKVKAHEATLPNHDEWRKNVLHFAGGTDLGQQQSFQSYLQTYSVTICDTLFGGSVFNFYKTTTAPIQITVSDSVKTLIDRGAAIITFFGHGSVSGFDQAIDDPSVYNNKDKYPLFIANSCYSGDIHLPEANSTSENFTLIENKGSIGFIASSSAGIVSPLYTYSKELYKSIAVEKYYQGVGDMVKNTCLKNSALNDQLTEITCLEMTLEGDPSVKLNGFARPDYKITNPDVFFDMDSHVDSIGINIKIKNSGKAINDTFVVRIERYFPNNDSTVFFKQIKAPFNQDTLSFFIIKDIERAVGLNRFKVFVDCYNEITELLENNNSTNGFVDLFISGGDVVPVYPYKYAIIPLTPQITLKASTADAFATPTNYKIQLDTNDRFVNPINSTIVNSVGGVIEWTVNLPFADSTVYFWRISKDSTTITDHYNWRESSFQVIGNKIGWGQAHFHQFKNDGFQFVKYKKQLRRFDFENDIASLMCRNGNLSGIAWDQIIYAVNGSQRHVWGCAQNGWSIAIFDSTTAQPRQSISQNAPNPGAGPFGNCHCDGTRPLYAFDFGTTNFCGFPNTWQTDLLNLLNSLPVNTKVLAYSAQNHQSESFNNALYAAFESIGSASIRNVKDTVPMIIYGKKGSAIGEAHEEIGLNSKSVVILNDSIKTNWNSGYVASEIIGPSVKWNSLHWRQVPIELPNTDSIVLKVVGIKANGVRDTLVTFGTDYPDVYNLFDYVNANNYPYMQLVARMKDDLYKTPPQLKRWQVLYDPVPECAINPKKGLVIAKDTVEQGDKLTVQLPIENIGTLPFTDSLVVTYWIEDANRVNHSLPQKLKAKPFIPAQVIMDTISFDTYQYPGLNYLWVHVNPVGNSKYQLEQYQFNNIARIPFTVDKDKVNPLLDVTFDGTRILNGDIVSAKPNILITLKDENKFLALNDTSNFAVYIKYPNQATETRLFFINALQFTPAQLPNNSCKIQWMPEFATDGKYTLRVQATDRSKNVSGAVDYTIQFEIINRQTVTEVLNYPNPFSTSTRFVFTLTGSEIPDVFTIQIMTITGKVVKEITRTELGYLHIGRNITEYAWDGKDEFGDKLGNGVYLYKVTTRQNGQSIEKNKTDADSFFKKGFGKLVIMR